MAEWMRSVSSPASVFDNMTSLGRALSHPKLSHAESSDDVHPPGRGNVPLHKGRRRKLSSCSNLNDSTESVTSPCAEARVLVINTGGTIGMTLRNNGSRALFGFGCLNLFSRRATLMLACWRREPAGFVCKVLFSHPLKPAWQLYAH